jgi:hypothetical protein
MKWTLIPQLSLFALAMGVATVFFIPSNIEPMFWLPIFLICAYLIAKNCAAGHFVHGVVLGLVNSVWITGAHVLLFNSYIATHAKEAQMMSSSRMAPKLMMIMVGPVVGLFSGVIIGLFAFVASKIVKPSATALPSQT